DLIRERETVLAGISDAFSTLDREWRYTYVNGNVAKLAGCPREKMIGRVIWEIFAEAIGGEFHKQAQRVMQTGEPSHGEFYYLPWKRWLDTRIYPTKDGIIIFRADITEQKKHEELAREREAKLAESQDRLRLATEAADQFLAMLSHELRTPLTPVLMTIAALRRNPDLNEDLRRDLEMLQRNVELEALLIDDLLDLTRIAHGKLELHSAAVDIHSLLDHALSISAGDLYGKNITVTKRFEAREHHCWADPARLQQVFWNLVKNAAKFTPEGGRLEITTGNIDHQIMIEVTDSGIGIDAELIPRIFNAFEQGGHVVTSKFGGLGLGLAISKRVVDLHQGTITARSAGPGQGAT